MGKQNQLDPGIAGGAKDKMARAPQRREMGQEGITGLGPRCVQAQKEQPQASRKQGPGPTLG